MDFEETVIDPTVDPSGGEPVSPAKGQEKPKEQAVDPKEFRALQARLTDQDRRIQELTESERYWADRAKGAAPAEERDDEDDDDEPVLKNDKPEEFVNDITGRGIQALVDRGVLTKKDARALIEKTVEKHTRKVVEEVVGRERTKLGTDVEIMTKYPDLRDQKSALFQKTSEIYKEVVRRSPGKVNDPEALLDAAERAKLTLEMEELKATPRRGREDDDEPEPVERRRQDRIKAQAPDRGRRSSEFEEDDNRLGDAAKDVIRQMGITEDEFTESRKKLSAGRRGR